MLQSGLSSQEDSLASFDLAVMLSLVQPAFSWLPIFQRYFAGSCSTRGSPGSPGPLLECSFPAKHHLACTGEYLGFFLLKGRIWHLPLLGFRRALLAKISSLLTCRGMAAQTNGTSGIPTIHPVFFTPVSSTLLHHPSDYWRCYNYWPHYQPLWSKYKIIYLKCLHAYLSSSQNILD